MKTIKDTSTIPRDTLSHQFWTEHQQDIMKFALCHIDKSGYVRVLVTEDYMLGSIRFIEGIDRRKFIVRGIGNPWEDSISDLFYLFYEIFYVATKTRYRFGEAYFSCTTINPSVYNPQ